MKNMPKVVCIAAFLALALDWALALASYLIPSVKAASQSSADNVIYLDQGWSQADRNTFYWIPQGTVMMSFDIYQNLELADSQELFRSDANIERYGLIPSPPDPIGNPDGLPIGITKQVTTESFQD